MERPWRDLLALSCFQLVCVGNWELSLLVRQHHPVGSHLWWWRIRFEVQREGYTPDVWKIKALPRERCCCCYVLFQGSCKLSWNPLPSRTLDSHPNLQPNSVRMLQCRYFVAVTCMLLLTGISRWQGPTQYCHSVMLHQCHWLDSKDMLPLIGCWAVITTSNNDIYFKEIRESWKQENWQWFFS